MGTKSFSTRSLNHEQQKTYFKSTVLLKNYFQHGASSGTTVTITAMSTIHESTAYKKKEKEIEMREAENRNRLA